MTFDLSHGYENEIEASKSARIISDVDKTAYSSSFIRKGVLTSCGNMRIAKNYFYF